MFVSQTLPLASAQRDHELLEGGGGKVMLIMAKP